MCERSLAAVSSPRWGVLYGATLPQLTALAVIEVAGPPNPLRTVLRLALGLGTFAGMAAWLRANRCALDLQDWCECAGRRMTVRVIESRRPRAIEPFGAAPRVQPAEREYELIER